MGQCIIIKNRWSSFKAYIDVIATPGSTVTATMGTTVYTDTAAANTGIVHFTVKKRGTYTITSNATSTQTATLDIEVLNEIYYVTIVGKFTLTLSNATGTTLSANRTSSGLGGGSTGVLTNGAAIYYGDVITFTAGNANSTVYNNPTLKVNNATFTSGGSHTVTGSVTAQTTTSVKTVTLTVSAGANSTITLARTASQYAGASPNSNLISKTGASGTVTVYYGDTISWTYSASTNYNIGTHTVGGTTRSSGYSWSATGNITCTTTANVQMITYYMYILTSSNGSVSGDWSFTAPVTYTMQNIIDNATYKKSTNTIANSRYTFTGWVYKYTSGANSYLRANITTGTTAPSSSSSGYSMYYKNTSGTVKTLTFTDKPKSGHHYQHLSSNARQY